MKYLQPQQKILMYACDLQYFDEGDEEDFSRSCRETRKKVHVFNVMVKSAADIWMVPGFELREVCLNLQTLTEPLDDGKGRRIADLDQSSTSDTQARSVSRLTGLRQILGDTEFGISPALFLLLQELKCHFSVFPKLLRSADERCHPERNRWERKGYSRDSSF